MLIQCPEQELEVGLSACWLMSEMAARGGGEGEGGRRVPILASVNMFPLSMWVICMGGRWWVPIIGRFFCQSNQATILVCWFGIWAVWLNDGYWISVESKEARRDEPTVETVSNYLGKNESRNPKRNMMHTSVKLLTASWKERRLLSSASNDEINWAT